MSTTAPGSSLPQPSQDRSRGRPLFWAGVCFCLLGLILVVVQFSLKYLFVPWYSPALATLGAVMLFVSFARRRSIPRAIGLVLIAAFAGFQWYFLVSLMKLPAYEGPAQAGKPFPPFRAALADGRPVTDADLRDGSRRVMVFFRGHW
jgi:hypothetical protein